MAKVLKVLVAEEDADLRGFLGCRLESAGYRVSVVADGDAAVASARESAPDVALVDTVLPGLSGLELIRSLKTISEDTLIVILTGDPSLDMAIGALRAGVFDYLRKPDDIRRAVDIGRNASNSVVRFQSDQHAPLRFPKSPRLAKPERLAGETGQRVLVGSSPEIQKVGRLVREVARSDMTVLLRGETGTGKDVVAHILHDLSDRRRAGEFCKVNCPSIQENLLESEMFGYERGAFTGADRQRPGRFEMASYGTVFLDEIGALTPAVQVKLLEVIESKSFFRVGGTEKIRVDVRIVAATNSPLEKEVKCGTFRADLFYRLQHYTIVLPPLRERTEDIVPLVEHFRAKYGAKYGLTQAPLPVDLMARMMRYPWPGNVRELESVCSRYMLTGNLTAIEEALEAADPAAELTRGRSVLEEREVQTLNAALSQTGWNQRQAAKLLGVSYSALRRRVAKYTLAKPDAYNHRISNLDYS